ncbi:hypothetical protein EV195_10383 [Tenacibaculum skagerrakense]|uniref:Uncharacterized protein n=1 Tax=Tenacibaculum skagerrakense TaxID=186571 RepID=A0A4R2NVX1_9FLAO|nr:hypothetical protein [Tenacibaculum skagerrakense]TCP25724.1 hypothetical protein EV195_10383 [Tenacibaculum skagerrakense]
MFLISLQLFIPSFLGALGQEVLHWFNLSRSLGNNVKVFNSKIYWIITIVSILFFGITSNYIVDFIKIDAITTNTKLFLTGMFYPIIIKSLLKVVTNLFNSADSITEEHSDNIQIKTFNNTKEFKPLDYLNKY